MRFWSETDGRYVDGESIWNGRDPLPGMDGSGFHIRGSYLVNAGLSRAPENTLLSPVDKTRARSKFTDAKAKQELAELATTNMDLVHRQTRRSTRHVALRGTREAGCLDGEL